MIENNILGIILAGGKSSRFGEDKSTAKLGNKTLLDHTVSKIQNEFNEILVISNNKEFNFKNNKIHVKEDCIEGQLGPLIGILTAMKWVIKNKKNYKWIASFPCDTPFFNIKLISELKIKVKETSKKLIFVSTFFLHFLGAPGIGGLGAASKIGPRPFGANEALLDRFLRSSELFSGAKGEGPDPHVGTHVRGSAAEVPAEEPVGRSRR